MASTFLKGTVVIILAGVVAILVLYETNAVSKCPVQQVFLELQLKRYSESSSPEMCASLNDKISQFDSQCNGDLEELDCG